MLGQLLAVPMKRVALHTLGCKLNFAETAALGRQFRDSGYDVVDFSEPAEVVVLNTCSVTGAAERECLQIIRRARRTSPDAAIIVTGCYAQLRPADIASIPGVNLVLGTKEKGQLLDYVSHLRSTQSAAIAVTSVESFGGETALASSAGYAERTRAFLKIQDGCDYQCSFCTIPRARGESRSVAPELVLKEAESIADSGYRELVLTGVNVGDYGRKIGTSLLSLLKSLVLVDGLERIRVSSIEPNLLNDGLLEFWLEEPKLCKHFHVPLQSGSDAVLAAMRRRYRASWYEDRVLRIIRAYPRAGIGADVLVGFPGESGGDFDETARFLADLPIAYIHVFPYSERPGTDAAGLKAVVDGHVRAERAETLRMISDRKREAFHSSQVGRTVSVLVESAHDVTHRTGLTAEYVRVDFHDASVEPNDMVDVMITGSDKKGCRGALVAAGGRSGSDEEMVYQSTGGER